MDSYAEHKREGFSEFPYVANEEVESGYEPMIAINRVFRNHSHLFVYDLETLQILLKQIGFVNIEKKIFMDGDDR